MPPTEPPSRPWFDGVPITRSVGVRSFLLLAALLVVVMASAVAFIGARNYDHETDLLGDRSASQARFLASVSPEAIFFRDFLTLETLVRNAIEDPSTVHVVFTDNDGTTMTRFIDRGDQRIVDMLDAGASPDSNTLADALVVDADVREVVQPVVSQGAQLGEVRVLYSIEPARENARRFVRDASVAAGIVLALVLIATTVIFRRKIRHPLRDLTHKTQALAAGEFHEGIGVDRRDEIGVLQSAFNEMARELQGTLVGLERARDDAERADRVKSDFLANMSHEIRTPLNALLGLSELLLDSNLTADQRELVTTMHRSGEALLEMLNEILDYSKLENNRLELDVEPFDVRELVDSTTDLFVAAAREKGVSVETDVAADVPRVVLGDEGRTRQVLVNLVGNAVKFTDRGSVRISVETAGDRLRFVVTDTGIGLDPDQADSLFEPFRQADSTTTRQFGGTGLGLAISQRLVEMMDGEIRATGAIGDGASFSFDVALPAANTATDRTAPSVAEIDRGLARRHPIRVLVAEDNTVNQLVATRMFARLGYSVDVAADGVEAIDMVLAGGYDLVLMDVQMPRLDGVQATQRIKSLLPAEQCPRIVACTAHALEGDRERYLTAGLDDYLSKPIELARVAAIIESTPPPAIAVDSRGPTPPTINDELDRPMDDIASSPIVDRAEVDDRSVIDREELVRLLGEDAEPLLAVLLPVFQADAVERLAAIRLAVGGGDAESLRLEAHALKGGARAIAITTIGDDAARLEAMGRAGDCAGADDLIASIERELIRVGDVVASSTSG